MASSHGLQTRRDDLKAELKSAHHEVEKARLNTKEAWQTALVIDRQITKLKKERDAAQEARDHTVDDREQLEAANQQLLLVAGQDVANAGMVDLKRQLDQAKQELESRKTDSSTEMLVERCAKLKKDLHDKDQQLLQAQAAGCGTDLIPWLRSVTRPRPRPACRNCSRKTGS